MFVEFGNFNCRRSFRSATRDFAPLERNLIFGAISTNMSLPRSDARNPLATYFHTFTLK